VIFIGTPSVALQYVLEEIRRGKSSWKTVLLSFLSLFLAIFFYLLCCLDFMLLCLCTPGIDVLRFRRLGFYIE
jgi:predicted permease